MLEAGVTDAAQEKHVPAVTVEGSLVKVEIAVCRGKSFADKRETLREREDKLEAKRLMARRG